MFKNQIINEPYRVKNYFIDLVFPEHKLAIEIDENGHIDRSEIKEQERERVIKEAGITLIRINPDKKNNFDTDDEIGEIQDFCNKFSFKLGKQSAINKIVEDTENLAKMAKQLHI